MPDAFCLARGEYANVTEFVTDANAAEEFNFVIGSRTILYVAVFSGRPESLALDFKAGKVHAAIFTALFPHLYRRT